MQKLSIFLTFQRFVESCKATTHIHTENPISGMSFLERQEKLHRFWQCKYRVLVFKTLENHSGFWSCDSPCSHANNTCRAATGKEKQLSSTNIFLWDFSSSVNAVLKKRRFLKVVWGCVNGPIENLFGHRSKQLNHTRY